MFVVVIMVGGDEGGVMQVWRGLFYSSIMVLANIINIYLVLVRSTAKIIKRSCSDVQPISLMSGAI